MQITLSDLIRTYQSDPVSTYQKLRLHVRKNHDGMVPRIVDRHGSTPLAEIKARTLLGWNAPWSGGGKLAWRVFHRPDKDDDRVRPNDEEGSECQRISMILHKMRFAAPKARTKRLTADQSIAIRV